MFKILDGRDKFYQWDLDRQLIVEDSTIAQVHFCNRTEDCSLICETFVEDGLTLVNVPNILLTTDWCINVYAYAGYTKYEKCFEVVSRTKPADYIYTETEVKNYEEYKEALLQLYEEVEALKEKEVDINLNLENGSADRALQQLKDAESWGSTNQYVKENMRVISENSNRDIIKNIDIETPIVGAFGKNSSMFGGKSQALGNKAHAEGSKTIAYENNSHAEGNETFAEGKHSHAEGNTTTAKGNSSHSEGQHTYARADASHAEGYYTEASGAYGAHSEGNNTKAIG